MNDEGEIWIRAITSLLRILGKTRKLLPVNNNRQHYWNTALENLLGISQNPTSISLRVQRYKEKTG